MSRISKRVIIVSICICVFLLTTIFSAWGYQNGRFDRAQTGCECHSGSADPSVTVTIGGLPAQYNPDETYPLTITVSGGPSTTNGGFNLEVSSGTLFSVDAHTQVNGPQNQATHNHPNQRTWTVNWQAPTPGNGNVNFWVAGNAVNGNGEPTGDGWNLFSVTVPEAIPMDTLPPNIYSVLIDGLVSKTVSPGTLVTLTARIDDTITGNSNIAGANYTIGPANWSSSTPMNPKLAPFDNPLEDVTISIDTTGWSLGKYDLYVYGWDVVPNYNFTSNAKATLTISLEQNPPEISNVLIDGSGSVIFPLSSDAPLALTATIDDSNTGNSDIDSANYTIGAQNWGSSQPMNLQNPPTSPTEVFEAKITPPTAKGIYRYYPYAQDVQGNQNYTNSLEYAQLTVIDDLGPGVSDVLIDGLSVKAVVAGTLVTITAEVDDSETGNSDIAGANYTIGAENWASSTSLNAQDGSFDSSLEQVTNTIDTTGWLSGSYDIYVYSWDEDLNYNLTSIAHATIIISSELIPPEISNVMVNGAQTQTYSISSIPTLTLSATIDDSNTGNSNVGGANYTIGLFGWGTSSAMALTNAPSSPTEDFSVSLVPPQVAGTYQYYVYAWDTDLNYNYTNDDQFATLIIVDDLAPRIKDVKIDEFVTRNLMKGSIVKLTAEIDDTETGGSVISGANYTIGATAWADSVSLDAADGSFDEALEIIEKSIDTTSWNPGTYTIYVYGYDDAQPENNHNITSGAFATLIIQSPPENVVVSKGDEKGTLEIEWDAATDDIVVGYNIYRSVTSGSGYQLIASLNATETIYLDSGLEDGKNYYYALTGVDLGGNETAYSTEVIGNTELKTDDGGDSATGILLVLILLIIIVIIIVLLVLYRRKLQSAE